MSDSSAAAFNDQGCQLIGAAFVLLAESEAVIERNDEVGAALVADDLRKVLAEIDAWLDRKVAIFGAATGGES